MQETRKGRQHIDDETRAKIAKVLREGITKRLVAERFGVRTERVAEIAYEAGLGPEPKRRTRESIERMARRQVVEVVDASTPRSIEELERALAAVRGAS